MPIFGDAYIHLTPDRNVAKIMLLDCYNKDTASFKDRASHGGGVRSNNRTSAYTRIEKSFCFDLQKPKIRLFTQNILVFIHIKIFVYT